MKSVALLLLTLSCATPQEDWPMYGGRPDRNMVSDAKGLPLKFDKNTNVLWTADLGKQTYGNPIVSGGRVFVGTNNGQPRDPAVKDDKGVLMCFSVKDGSFLWQAVHDKLDTGDAEDWAEIGICSAPCVVGDRVYYVSNRGELVCADTEGFTDGDNDGPYKDEKRAGKQDADFVWILDVRKELGVRSYQAFASSPLVVGDRVYIVTGQGIDDQTHEVRNPEAPSFIAVNRRTGKVEWKDSSPGKNIREGSWGSPAYGKGQVAFPGGDGVLYAFEPESGKLLWKFDCLQHEKKKTGNHLLATPVYSGDRVFIAVGQNPEEGSNPGCLRAIDAGTGKEVWKVAGDEFGSSISSVAVHDGLVYAVELDGYFGCYDIKDGKRYWRHDLLSTVWGAPLVADGRIYIRNGDGEVVIMKTGKKAEVLANNEIPGLFQGSVTAVGGVLYLASETKLYAVREK